MTSDFHHLIDLNDYTVSSWNKLLSLAQEIISNPRYFSHRCSGKVMGTLFYEPSTRTQMSFQTAMIRLGGSIIGFDNPSTSSVSKGENLKDTTKIVSSYADILVMRHPLEGSVKAAALTSDCPVINAGDGGHLHPTQTLTDLLTLQAEKGRLDNLTIGLCGDLMNGRTVHSLVKAMSCYNNNRFVLISTAGLMLPSYIKDILNSQGCEYTEVESLEEAIGALDVLYMTRIQRERFESEAEYLLQKNVYVLDRQKLLKARKDLCVLHPLPRVDEILVEVDDDPRAMYFKQAKYGVFVRMALILTMLEAHNTGIPLLKGKTISGVCCANKKCITNHEYYLPKSFVGTGDTLICEFCDERKLI
ncbi:MAG: aspartate carbamoyltransferase [Oscillospiraceae bacterium]|jgi:aspartate carbamoyltransferase catalytic subunit